MQLQRYDVMEENFGFCYAMDVKRFLLYFIILLPGIKDPLYQLTLLEELRVEQKFRMKMSVVIEKEHKNLQTKQQRKLWV